MDFCHLQEIYQINMEKNIRYCYKNRTRCSKHSSQKVVHKAAKATGELL